jgi:single-stranded-DNA-specific exonuclease
VIRNWALIFFLTESSEKFVQVLERLKSIENERQKCIDSTFQLTLNIAKVYPNIVIAVIPANTASSMSIKTNYLGAVASKLRDYFHKTAVLIMVRDGKCFGELRSNHINLFEFLNKIKDLFLDFGGHRRAAGFSMLENNLDKFTKYGTGSINVPLEQDREERRPDAILDKAKINLLEPLLPFGEGNPSPLLTDGVDLYTIDNRMNIIELGLWQT